MIVDKISNNNFFISVWVLKYGIPKINTIVQLIFIRLLNNSTIHTLHFQHTNTHKDTPSKQRSPTTQTSHTTTLHHPTIKLRTFWQLRIGCLQDAHAHVYTVHTYGLLILSPLRGNQSESYQFLLIFCIFSYMYV